MTCLIYLWSFESFFCRVDCWCYANSRNMPLIAQQSEHFSVHRLISHQAFLSASERFFSDKAFNYVSTFFGSHLIAFHNNLSVSRWCFADQPKATFKDNRNIQVATGEVLKFSLEEAALNLQQTSPTSLSSQFNCLERRQQRSKLNPKWDLFLRSRKQTPHIRSFLRQFEKLQIIKVGSIAWLRIPSLNERRRMKPKRA